jgi:hypothetical protein
MLFTNNKFSSSITQQPHLQEWRHMLGLDHTHHSSQVTSHHNNDQRDVLQDHRDKSTEKTSQGRAGEERKG